ncbi:hypothetical protein DL764_006247 [Monosporascus ibericus]|uniref:AB hydrolase-1 domain-containing protein n=1 Tax=Monosporascus ibericus TaxID=155417 RepID=A0A4Q4T8Q2_9PEZI|nr:hypothetical protein DL764_006247 [Monosporascus ibericus]
MLGGEYACSQPQELKKLVISSGPASIPLMAKEYDPLIAQLAFDIRETLEDRNIQGGYDSEVFEKAASVFYARHVCRQGTSKFVTLGSFENWEIGQEARKVEAETLLLNGKYDEATDMCMVQWFRVIPKVKSVTFENSNYMGHWERESDLWRLSDLSS